MAEKYGSGSHRSEAIALDGLLAAPLLAASRANSAMAKEQLRFILDVCFSNSEDNVRRPVMVSLSISRVFGAAEGVVSAAFNVPVLTLLPISALAIDTVNISYGLELTTQVAVSGANRDAIEPQLHGHVASSDRRDSGDRSDAGNRGRRQSMDVQIAARPIPLPNGLTSIIDLYTKAIHLDTELTVGRTASIENPG